MDMNNCEKCSHVWLGRVEKPKRCPKCKCLFWDEKKTYGKYNFSSIGIGEQKVIKWIMKRGQDMVDFKAQQSMRNALSIYQRRTGRVFHQTVVSDGINIIRVS